MTERKAKMNWEVVSNVSCLVPIFRRQPLDFRIQFPGRNTVCCQGTCLMGPDHGTWCCSNSLIIGNCALFVFYVAIPVHWAMAALAIALLLVVEYQLWSATFTEAGILPRQPYELTPSGQPAPTVIVNGVTVHLKSCNTCNIYRSAGATARIIAHSVTRACMQTTAREALPRLRQLRGRVRSLQVADTPQFLAVLAGSITTVLGCATASANATTATLSDSSSVSSGCLHRLSCSLTVTRSSSGLPSRLVRLLVLPVPPGSRSHWIEVCVCWCCNSRSHSVVSLCSLVDAVSAYPVAGIEILVAFIFGW